MICAAQHQQQLNADRVVAPSPTMPLPPQQRQPTIAPMEQSSIQRIVAGQAVTDMASAVKELVDNALDAGAKTINIRLFNLGLDVIEVSDDGCGVPMESRPFMAMKHATSKIRSFQDIYNQDNGDAVPTLGFRGEALFCLANLSHNLVVATRTASDVLAQKLEYQRDGTIRPGSSESIARKVGTTVAIVQLFDALPVRRTDFGKRIQAQRTRLFQLLQGYAILCLGVRITLMDVGGSRGEEVRMRSSDLSKTLEQTVSSVLGSRFLSGLTRVSVDLPSGDGSKLQGLVANLNSSVKDVQFFSINGRPVELPALSRAMAEVWRGFPTKKSRPACILQLTLPPSAYDVNLSPDKRSVLLTNQDELIEALQTTLLELWSSQDQVFQAKTEPQESSPISPQKTRCSPNKVTSVMSPRRVKRRMAFVHDFNRAKLQHETENDELQGEVRVEESQETNTTSSPLEQQRPSDAERRQWTEAQQAFRRHRHQSEEDDPQRRLQMPTDFKTKSTPSLPPRRTVEPADNSIKTTRSPPTTDVGAPARKPKKSQRLTLEDFAFRPVQKASSSKAVSTVRSTDAVSTTPRAVRKVSLPNQKLPSVSQSPPIEPPPASTGAKRVSPHSPSTPGETASVKRPRLDQTAEQDEFSEPEDDDEVVMWDQFNGTNEILEATKASRIAHVSQRRALKNVATASAPSSASVKLEKSHFSQMKVLGQFNLGFIVCLDQRSHHLWILDQHACDEKYNFERLCRETKLKEQPLIKPMLLSDLSPPEESCVLDHLDVFEANGFRFRYDADKPPRERLLLTAIPYSKDVQFGPADVSALCAMLNNQTEEGVAVNSRQNGGGTGADGSGLYGNNAVRRYAGVSSQTGSSTATKCAKIVARLPKAVAMLANRACRGSIMVGSALSQNELTSVVTHLQQVEHPWNCPHGRPTLCHVQHMGEVLLGDAQRQAQLIAGPTITMLSQQPLIDE